MDDEDFVLKAQSFFEINDKVRTAPGVIFTGCFERAVQYLCNLVLARTNTQFPPPGIVRWIDAIYGQNSGSGLMLDFLKWSIFLKHPPFPEIMHLLSMQDAKGVLLLEKMVNLRNQWVRPKGINPDEVLAIAMKTWDVFLMSGAGEIFGSVYGSGTGTTWTLNANTLLISDYIRVQEGELSLVEKFNSDQGIVVWDAKTLSHGNAKQEAGENNHPMVALRANDPSIESPSWSDLAYKLESVETKRNVSMPTWLELWSKSDKSGILVIDRTEQALASNSIYKAAFGKNTLCIRVKGTRIAEFDKYGLGNPVPETLSKVLGYTLQLSCDHFRNIITKGKNIIFIFSDFPAEEAKSERILLKSILYLSDISCLQLRFVISVPEERARMLSERLDLKIPQEFTTKLFIQHNKYFSLYNAFWGIKKKKTLFSIFNYIVK